MSRKDRLAASLICALYVSCTPTSKVNTACPRVRCRANHQNKCGLVYLVSVQIADGRGACSVRLGPHLVLPVAKQIPLAAKMGPTSPPFVPAALGHNRPIVNDHSDNLPYVAMDNAV
jgi:hypothetical protein